MQDQTESLAQVQVRYLSLRLLSRVLMLTLLLVLLLLKVLLLLRLLLQVQVLKKVGVWPQLLRGWVTGCPTCRTAHSSCCPQQHHHSSASEQYACPLSCVVLSSTTRSHPALRTHHGLPTRLRLETDCSPQAVS